MDFIASKKVNPKGQIDEISDISSLNYVLSSTFDRRRSLIANQYENIKEVLELAKHNLILSSGNLSTEMSKKLFLSTDKNLTEKITSEFLMNSIVYYNSSFDYLKSLLRIRFSSHEDLINDFKVNKIKAELDRLKLQKSDWQLAFLSIITHVKQRDFDNWLEERKSSNKKGYDELKKMNKDLKDKYQANQLKHSAMPHFSRSDPGNAYGSRYLVSLEQFYCKNNTRSEISFGFPRNSLDIDDTQKFLIGYNNKTVEVVESLELTKNIKD